ncbi:MAG TPA: hypothetical protein VHN77_04485 [Phycisphaerales bacterium]|nr:hypothetical protein [Phycisphaerales bacterium]
MESPTSGNATPCLFLAISRMHTSGKPKDWRRARATAATAVALSVSLWLFSTLFHTAFTYYGSWTVGLLRGVFIVERFDPPLAPGTRLGGQTVDTCRTQLSWSPEAPYVLPRWRSSGPPLPMTTVMIPLWLLVLPAAAATAHFHRRLRASQLAGCCRTCGYDTAGLAPGAPCPECGTRPRQTPDPSTWTAAQHRWSRRTRSAAIACALLMLLWITTCVLSLTFVATNRLILGLSGGACVVSGYEPLSPEHTTPRLRFERDHQPVLWIPALHTFPAGQTRTPPINWVAMIPLWPLPALAAGLTLLARQRFHAADA